MTETGAVGGVAPVAVSTETSSTSASDFFNGYAVGALLGIAAIVFSWFIRSTPREPHADADGVSAETAGATPPAAPISVTAGD